MRRKASQPFSIDSRRCSLNEAVELQDTILGGFPSAEFAHQGAVKLLSAAGPGVAREWQIGIAASGDNAALEASQLANAAAILFEAGNRASRSERGAT